MRDFHILRLGARIWGLRHEGYEIEERKVEGKSWSEYRLRPPRYKNHTSLSGSLFV
jgi:Helix-turn-helix domain